MNDIVHLSRSKGLNAAREDTPRSGAARVGLVLSREVGRPTVWAHWSKNHALWYRHACILNSLTFYQWADCQKRCKGFVRSLPIAVSRRYHDRADKLDFYLQETLPTERRIEPFGDYQILLAIEYQAYEQEGLSLANAPDQDPDEPIQPVWSQS